MGDELGGPAPSEANRFYGNVDSGTSGRTAQLIPARRWAILTLTAPRPPFRNVDLEGNALSLPHWSFATLGLGVRIAFAQQTLGSRKGAKVDRKVASSDLRSLTP